jgi:hypothetical protein
VPGTGTPRTRLGFPARRVPRITPPTRPAAAVASPATTGALDAFAFDFCPLPDALPSEEARLRGDTGEGRRREAFPVPFDDAARRPALFARLRERSGLLSEVFPLLEGLDRALPALRAAELFGLVRRAGFRSLGELVLASTIYARLPIRLEMHTPSRLPRNNQRKLEGRVGGRNRMARAGRFEANCSELRLCRRSSARAVDPSSSSSARAARPGSYAHACGVGGRVRRAGTPEGGGALRTLPSTLEISWQSLLRCIPNRVSVSVRAKPAEPSSALAHGSTFSEVLTRPLST